MDVSKALEAVGLTENDAIRQYPNLFIKTMSLSSTGVSSRTYSHWEKMGLVESSSDTRYERTKLGLREYVWLKIIQSLRNYGMPLEGMIGIKGFLFHNFLEEILKDSTVLKNQLSASGMQEEKVNTLVQFFATANKPEFTESWNRSRVFFSVLGEIVTSILVLSTEWWLVLNYDKEEYTLQVFNSVRQPDLHKAFSESITGTSVIIPVNKMVEEFLQNPVTEKHLNSLGLLSDKEKQLINIIRSGEFNEINIKMAKDSTIKTISGTASTEVRDEEARKIMKILGLKEYQNVIIKQRNKHHLYIENTIRFTDPADPALK